MKLRFTQRAIRDLADISAYLNSRNPTVAKRVRADILDTAKTLILFPEIGRAQNVPGIRKLVTRKYSYLVFYIAEPEAKEVIIVTIQHPARAREHDDI